MEEKNDKKKRNYKVVFFWVAYAALLLASVPHMAYVFMSTTDNVWPEWIISYCISGVIEFSIYISSWSIFQLMRGKINWGKVIAIIFLFIWNVVCTAVSWYLNSIHAAHFRNPSMLIGSEVIPGSQYLIYITGSFPIFGIIFSLVSRVATTDYVELTQVDERTPEQIIAEAERDNAKLIAKASTNKVKAQLAGENIRNQIQNVGGGLVAGARGVVQEALVKREATTNQPVEQLDYKITQIDEARERRASGNLQIVSPQTEEEKQYTDDEKLQIAITALKENENITAEEMAVLLHLDKPAAARIWIARAKSSIDAENTEIPANEEERIGISAEWPEVKIVDGKSVGFSTIKPFYIEDTLTFVNISSAYQNKGKNPEVLGASMKHKLLTTENMRAVIRAKKIPAQYVRFIKVNSWGKDSISMAILIDPKVKNKLIEAIKTL